MNTRTQLAAILGIIAGVAFGVGYLELPTGVAGEVRLQDEDPVRKARVILKNLDDGLRERRSHHNAPKLGKSLQPWAFEARTTEMVELDQYVRAWQPPSGMSPEVRRLVWAGIVTRMRSIDTENTRELKRWVQRNEWPTLSRYGDRSGLNAWLIAQHADLDPEFQKIALRQIGNLAKRGEARREHYAYLWDRVAVNEKRLQKFATQGRCVAPNAWEAWPFVRPAEIDERRAKMGLSTYAEYRRQASKMCANFRR